jgi:hypothetical protein
MVTSAPTAYNLLTYTTAIHTGIVSDISRSVSRSVNWYFPYTRLTDLTRSRVTTGTVTVALTLGRSSTENTESTVNTVVTVHGANVLIISTGKCQRSNGTLMSGLIGTIQLALIIWKNTNHRYNSTICWYRYHPIPWTRDRAKLVDHSLWGDASSAPFSEESHWFINGYVHMYTPHDGRHHE